MGGARPRDPRRIQPDGSVTGETEYWPGAISRNHVCGRSVGSGLYGSIAIGTAVLLLVFAGLIPAVIAAVILIPAVFFVFRRLYDSDPYWGEHLTTHRWPTTTWLGK